MKKLIWFKGAKTGGSSLREIFCKQVYNISYESVLKKGVTMEDYDITNKEFLWMPNTFWAEYYYNQNKETFNNAIIICSIRHPIDRFLSGCRHFKLDPNTLIDNMPIKLDEKIWVHLGQSIHNFLLDGKVRPHYWIRQESLIKDTQAFCDAFRKHDERFNVRLKNIHKNISRKRKWDISEETKQKILNFFEKDLKYFNNASSDNAYFLESL